VVAQLGQNECTRQRPHGRIADTDGYRPPGSVNGPIRKELGFNSGINVFGPGPAFRANATVGCALRLIM